MGIKAVNRSISYYTVASFIAMAFITFIKTFLDGHPLCFFNLPLRTIPDPPSEGDII